MPQTITNSTSQLPSATLSGDVTGLISANHIASGAIMDSDINAAANIADSKLATIVSAGKVSNTATTANSNNIRFAIVCRDSNNKFIASQMWGDVDTAGTVLNVGAANAAMVNIGTAAATNRQRRYWNWPDNNQPRSCR